MPNPTHRRLASPDDLAAVHAIYMHPEVVPYLGIDPAPLAQFEPVFAALVATRSFYVVSRDGKVLGFYRLNRHPGRARHVVTLETFAISPAEKGTGLAAAMIEEAIALARADGVSRVELLVEADNARAVAFYYKLGFEQEGRLRGAYKRSHEAEYHDDILMAKLFPPII